MTLTNGKSRNYWHVGLLYFGISSVCGGLICQFCLLRQQSALIESYPKGCNERCTELVWAADDSVISLSSSRDDGKGHGSCLTLWLVSIYWDSPAGPVLDKLMWLVIAGVQASFTWVGSCLQVLVAIFSPFLNCRFPWANSQFEFIRFSLTGHATAQALVLSDNFLCS